MGKTAGVSVYDMCIMCGGSGVRDGSREACPWCDGEGMVETVATADLKEDACIACRGKKKDSKGKVCKACQGSGKARPHEEAPQRPSHFLGVYSPSEDRIEAFLTHAISYKTRKPICAFDPPKGYMLYHLEGGMERITDLQCPRCFAAVYYGVVNWVKNSTTKGELQKKGG